MKNIITFDKADIGYGKTKILRDITCSIERGESVGIVGPNGSGKTTFLRGVLGILSPFSGTIEIDKSQCFAYVPQAENLNFFLPMTVREVVALPYKAKGFLRRLTQEEKDAVELAMEKAGITPIADLLIRECSGGQTQKTILAQAISQKPDVLLLDEPTRGLDVVAERDFLNLIQQLKQEGNLTILFVTHSLHIPLNFMGKIMLVDKGSVISTTPIELVNTKKLEEIYNTPFLHHEYGGFKWVMPLTEAVGKSSICKEVVG